MRPRTILGLLVLAGFVLGVVIGQVVLYRGEAGALGEHWIRQAGELVLLRPLQILVVPLVFVSVVVGAASIGAPSRLGVVGGATVVYYVTTMLMAATLGTALAASARPGAIDAAAAAPLTSNATAAYARSGLPEAVPQVQGKEGATLGRAFMDVLEQLVPPSIVDEMLQGRTLGMIAFALLLGLALAAGGEKTAAAVRFFEALFDALMRLVGWVMWLVPPGVFMLVAWAVGNVGLDNVMGPIAKYIAVVGGGLAIHMFVVLPLILLIFARSNPLRFMLQMRVALMTACATDSSSAALPLTMECAVGRATCSRRASGLVLPLGAAMNRNGTALYEAVAAVFLFQLYGIELEFSQLLVVAITATLVAIGAPGLPSTGLLMIVIVINAVNTSLGDPARVLPLEAIGVIVGVDRLVGMCGTTVNVWGDAVAAKIMSRIAPD
jgi:Na+/H+-dicarboxylate symporter